MSDYDYSDDYDDYSDEYDYESDDYDEHREGEIIGQSTRYYIHKGKSGHVCVVFSTIMRYRGEDWGQASGYVCEYVRLHEFSPETKDSCLRIAKKIKNGESIEYDPYDDDDEDED